MSERIDRAIRQMFGLIHEVYKMCRGLIHEEPEISEHDLIENAKPNTNAVLSISSQERPKDTNDTDPSDTPADAQ
jgi:hypothetical protein